MKVDFRGIATYVFDMMLNVLQYQRWSLELHSQLGSELRGRPMGISLGARYQSGSTMEE